MRDATDDDIPVLVDLINAAYKPRDGHVFAGLRTDADEVRSAIESTGSRMLVAEVDGAIAACVRLVITSDETWFGLLATSVSHQGRGLAPMLIGECERRARDAGARVMGIGVIREVGLQGYYETLGYRYVRETPGDQLGWTSSPTLQPFTLVDMEKAL
jgi:predicted N-acetyltransferase YhbS